MIPYGKHFIDEEDVQAVVNVLRSGTLTQGPTVEAFEKAIANYVGVKYAVAVSSCTAALHLSALAAGVGPANTLITSPISFVSSANAGLYTGAQVAFADIEPSTINICPQALKESLKRNPNTRVIIPVHFAGLPCDMSAIKAIADQSGADIIEDSAHALGARYADGKRVGSCAYSLMTVFSFHPVKAIAGGEGGMITTNDEAIYRKLLRLRSHGINKLDDSFELPDLAQTNYVSNPWYYEMQELGFHYRITDIQCALALSQFKKIEKFIDFRREIVKDYDTAFKDMRNCRPAQSDGRDRSGHHLYVLRINFDSIGMSRAELMNKLRSRGIGSQVHYIPIPMQPYYRRLGHKYEDYPNALKYYKETLSIGLYYNLIEEHKKSIISAVQEFVG